MAPSQRPEPSEHAGAPHPPRPSPPIPRLHVVTDDRVLARPDLVARAVALMEAGGSRLAFHVRGPHATGAAVHALARALAPAAGAAGAVLQVNDRVDVALAVGAGAHLGRRSLPPSDARRLLGPGARIGQSVREGASVDAEADYLFLGNVFPTPSHPGRAGVGPEGLADLVRTAGVPVLAIGGVTPARVGDVLAVGAHGVAVLGGVWSDPDPVAAVAAYLDALSGTTTP